MWENFKISISLYGLILSWTLKKPDHRNQKSLIFKQRLLFLVNALNIGRKHGYCMIKIMIFSSRVFID